MPLAVLYLGRAFRVKEEYSQPGKPATNGKWYLTVMAMLTAIKYARITDFRILYSNRTSITN